MHKHCGYYLISVYGTKLFYTPFSKAAVILEKPGSDKYPVFLMKIF